MKFSAGTITDEHLRASLLSAVEDKLRRKLRDTVGQANVCIISENTFTCLGDGEGIRSDKCGLGNSIPMFRPLMTTIYVFLFVVVACN